MKRINLNVDLFFDKIIPRQRTNFQKFLIKNTRKNINDFSNDYFKVKSSQKNSNGLFCLETAFKKKVILINHTNQKNNKNNYLLFKTVSKLYASENINCENDNNQQNIHINKTSDIKIDNLKPQKISLNNENDSNNPNEENKDQNVSEPINFNPELIDKQSKIFSLTDKLPEKFQYYIKLGRYDRPIGYLLLFYPCSWSLTLMAPMIDFNYLYNIFLFFSGSVLMRSAGCIINDMWDRNIDKMVERSKNRPLAAGYLSMKEASVYLAGHLALSLGILLQLPANSIITGLSIMPIVIIYPFMKRISNIPQLFLGLAFTSGFLVGYGTYENIIHLDIVLPFYFGGILWTIIYDTIYAHMDKLDDAKINVKSTALYFGRKTKEILIVLWILMFIGFAGGFYFFEKRYISDSKQKKQEKIEFNQIKDIPVNMINNNNINSNPNTNSEFDLIKIKESISNKIFDSLLISRLFLYAGFLYQLRLIKKVNLNNPLNCLRAFKNSSYFGLFILASCLLIASKKKENIQKDENKKIKY